MNKETSQIIKLLLTLLERKEEESVELKKAIHDLQDTVASFYK